MMFVVNVLTRKKDYGPSQPNLGKEPTPLENYLHIGKLESIPRIPKGVLKCSKHNPNAQEA